MSPTCQPPSNIESGHICNQNAQGGGTNSTRPPHLSPSKSANSLTLQKQQRPVSSPCERTFCARTFNKLQGFFLTTYNVKLTFQAFSTAVVRTSVNAGIDKL